jgi:dTDP-4-dehydrorhamnose reductase
MVRFGRILLTGVNGQVGHELQRSLQPLGEVFALDRAQLDLTDTSAIHKVVQDIQPDLIVNPAAYTAVDKAESEPELAHAINALAPAALAQQAAKLNALLVHYSTDYVYDGHKTQPYLETDATNPLSVYGRTKLAGEQAIQTSGVSHLILRTSWVYGARGKNFMKTMIKLATERDVLRVVADQFGAPTSSRSIAQATVAALSVWQANLAGTYHLTCKGSTSWHGFSQAILTAYAQRRDTDWPMLKVQPGAVQAITTKDYPTPAVRPVNSRLDCSKLEKAFNLALPTWQQALDEVMQEFQVAELST